MESRLHFSINRNNKFIKCMIFLKTDSDLRKKNPDCSFVGYLVKTFLLNKMVILETYFQK